jgi:uncharacterized delta-60 repeat protein
MLMAAVVLTLARPGMTHAAPGDLDAMFGTSGVFAAPFQSVFPGEREQRVALDHLERPVLAATVDPGTTHSFRIAVARLTTGGVLDTSFNPGGSTPGLLVIGFSSLLCPDDTIDGPVLKALAVTPDHHIVLAADLCRGNAKTRIGLVRLDNTGAFDSGFDGDGRLVTDLTGTDTYAPFVEDIAVDAMERIYVAGAHCISGPQTDCQFTNALIARFTSAGVRDVTYNSTGAIPGILEIGAQGVRYSFNAMRLLSDDRVVAAGSYQPDATMDAFVARLSNTGAPDTTFGPTGTPAGTVHTGLGRGPGQTLAEAFGVAVNEDDDSVFLTGQVTDTTAKMAFAKLTAIGDPDATFAVGGPASGVTYVLSDQARGTDVLIQPNGKAIVVGTGPTAGQNPTGQFVVARYDSVGQLDPTFGATSPVPGIVETPLGDQAFAWDVVLQSDGKIIVGGERRVPLNDIAAVAVRYIGGESQGGGPTPTVTPQPTPTATPIDLPGENCANCIDDEGDGYLDRDDPECPPRANGGGQGLGTPKVGGKAIAKCAKGVQAAGTKFGHAKLQALQQCVNGVFSCLQLEPTDTKCSDKASIACTKRMVVIAKNRTKLTDAVTKACDVPALTVDDVRAIAGLGYGFETQVCADRGLATLATLDDVAACVGARHDCAVEQLLAMEVPRAAELLLAGGRNPAVDVPCLPLPAPTPALGLADPARAKAAVVCQKAIAKAGGKFLGGKQKVVQACLQAVTSCVQQKPADQMCLASARAKCSKQIAQLTAPDGVEAKLQAAVAKDCATLDATELTGGAGLGYQERAAECIALHAAGADSAAAVGDCVRRQHECRVEQMLEATTPRLRELLGIGQVSLP